MKGKLSRSTSTSTSTSTSKSKHISKKINRYAKNGLIFQIAIASGINMKFKNRVNFIKTYQNFESQYFVNNIKDS